MLALKSVSDTRSSLDLIRDRALVRSRSHVDGAWTRGSGDASIPVLDPATERPIGEIAALTAADSRAAIDAAARAFPAWADMRPQDRGSLIRRWGELMLQAKEDLALIMTLEQGKPISEALGEIDYAADFLSFYAEEARRLNVESVTSHLPDADMRVMRQPLGVVALITPWNFPSAMITRKAGAALAAGCTLLIHPSVETPFSALALAELAERAGFPPGVINILAGDAPTIVRPWMDSPVVRGVSFTGSTEVGRLLYAQSAPTVKRMVLELGGHAPFIVFADADLDRAVDEAVKAKFATSGQDCLGANRLFIQRAVYDEFCAAFAERAARLSVGPGLEDPDIGPLMHDRMVAKQVAHVRDAVAKGAKILTGGSVHPAGARFFQPTVLCDVPADALILRQETFGPVAALLTFDDEAEVIARANDTEHGLVAYVHSSDPQRIARLTRALDFGMVAVNRTKITGAPIPFGGWKQSGLGREGARQGMEAFSELKYVCAQM